MEHQRPHLDRAHGDVERGFADTLVESERLPIHSGPHGAVPAWLLKWVSPFNFLRVPCLTAFDSRKRRDPSGSSRWSLRPSVSSSTSSWVSEQLPHSSSHLPLRLLYVDSHFSEEFELIALVPSGIRKPLHHRTLLRWRRSLRTDRRRPSLRRSPLAGIHDRPRHLQGFPSAEDPSVHRRTDLWRLPRWIVCLPRVQAFSRRRCRWVHRRRRGCSHLLVLRREFPSLHPHSRALL